MNYLEEQHIGFQVGEVKVPIVTGAVIFDLDVGDPKIRPDIQMGWAAVKNATVGDFPQGNIGAGCGATVGKLAGPDKAMKAGLGSASVKGADDLVSYRRFLRCSDRFHCWLCGRLDR